MGAVKQSSINEMESREIVGNCQMCECDLYEEDTYYGMCTPCETKLKGEG